MSQTDGDWLALWTDHIYVKISGKVMNAQYSRKVTDMNWSG